MNAPLGSPLRILLSQQAKESLQGEVARVMGGRPYELVSIETATSCAPDVADIDVAFISRDVTGLSTKHEPADSLQACYAVLRRSVTLKWIHIHSAGADRPIYVELRARGVTVTTSSGANADVVAQSALAGLLALSRRFPQLMAAQRAHAWAPLLGAREPPDLCGQTAVLVGWGPIGQRIGAFLQLLGMQLVVVRQTAIPSTDALKMVTFEALHDVLPRADWLVLACPLTDKTRGLLDARALQALPRGACMVNVARGEVVVEAELVAALKSAHLGGACLDVFQHEPLAADSPLWDMENVIVTPHSAGHSSGNALRVTAQFLENLRRWNSGDNLRNVIQ